MAACSSIGCNLDCPVRRQGDGVPSSDPREQHDSRSPSPTARLSRRCGPCGAGRGSRRARVRRRQPAERFLAGLHESALHARRRAAASCRDCLGRPRDRRLASSRRRDGRPGRSSPRRWNGRVRAGAGHQPRRGGHRHRIVRTRAGSLGAVRRRADGSARGRLGARRRRSADRHAPGLHRERVHAGRPPCPARADPLDRPGDGGGIASRSTRCRRRRGAPARWRSGRGRARRHRRRARDHRPRPLRAAGSRLGIRSAGSARTLRSGVRGPAHAGSAAGGPAASPPVTSSASSGRRFRQPLRSHGRGGARRALDRHLPGARNDHF